MNCKPGDLAVVIKSYAGNEGKVVRCLTFFPNGITFADGSYVEEPCWRVDSNLKQRDMLGLPRGESPYAVDAWLKPLRGNVGEDEMLRIAGLPKKETQNAG